MIDRIRVAPLHQLAGQLQRSVEMDAFRVFVRRKLEELSDEAQAEPGASLGLAGVVIPTEFGGMGLGVAEIAVVLQETGRVLLPGSFFGTAAMAAQALVAGGDSAVNGRWLPRIADGTATATLALAAGSSGLESARVQANFVDARWVLSGSIPYVVDGDIADLLLVVAEAETETGLFAVDAGTQGIRRLGLDALDHTRRIARVDFHQVNAVRVETSEPAGRFARRVRDLVLVAMAAEQAGGARGCLESTVEYAKNRLQFGRPIGSFQAIKHKCAESLIDVECAEAAATNAAFVAGSVSSDPVALEQAAALAAACCSETFVRVAKRNIQVHGGAGFTWADDAHRFLRRAKSSQSLIGSPDVHRRRLVSDAVGS